MKNHTKAAAKRRRRNDREEIQRQLRDAAPDWKDIEDAEIQRIERQYDDDDLWWAPEDWLDDDDWGDDRDELDFPEVESAYDYYDQDWLYENPPPSGDLLDNLRTCELFWNRLTTAERVQVEWMVSKAAEIARNVIKIATIHG